MEASSKVTMAQQVENDYIGASTAQTLWFAVMVFICSEGCHVWFTV